MSLDAGCVSTNSAGHCWSAMHEHASCRGHDRAQDGESTRRIKYSIGAGLSLFLL